MKKEKASLKARGKQHSKGEKITRRRPLNIWAVVAIVLAAGMILSTLFIGIDYLTGWRGPSKDSDDPDSWKEQLDQEWQRLIEESAALEAKIAVEEPAVEDLESLAVLYSHAYSYALWLEPDTAEDYLEKTVKTYRSLLDHVPDSIEHRFSLCGALRALGQEEEAQKEADFILAALEPLLEAEAATNLERYYYAALQADLYGNKAEALEQLDLILETEPEDSPYYEHFTAYREQLQAGDSASPGEEQEGDQAGSSQDEEDEAGSAG